MASDCPATATSLTDKRMIVALMFSTAVRAESNRMEASAIYGNVEVAGAFRAEEGKGGFQSILLLGLHQNPAHTSTHPIRR